jgi:uncharacterized RDD family membrane protein YckC
METNFVGEGTQARCVECRNVFPIDEMIPHGDMRVCVRCKPKFLQKLAEGARMRTSALDFAGVGIRFAAIMLDAIILWMVSAAVQLLAFGSLVAADPTGGAAPMVIMISFLLQFAIAISYEAVLIGKYGATLGKMACRIQVVTPDGQVPGYMRATGRYFAKLLSAFTLMIGYLMAFWDDEKRTLHDRICNTRVVRN